jgi:hypothetical protein
MSLQDYAQRKYDYLGLRGVNPNKEAKLGLELFNASSNGQICTGVQKLAQRWLLEFMTETGSMPGLPDRGCEFMVHVRQGRLRTQIEIQALFSATELDVRRNLQREEYDDMPDDERLAFAELLSSAILPGYVQIRVKINNRLGDTREIIVPVATLP